MNSLETRPSPRRVAPRIGDLLPGRLLIGFNRHGETKGSRRATFKGTLTRRATDPTSGFIIWRGTRGLYADAGRQYSAIKALP